MQQIIDINGMIGYWPSFTLRFHDAAGLLAEMDSYHINSCVAFHSDALWDVARGNGAIRTIAAESGGRIRPCYLLRSNLDSAELPDAPTLLTQLRRERPVAVKLYPALHRYVLDGFYAGELLDLLNELAMPVLFDFDQKPAYDALPTLARNYPRIKFIILRQQMNESRYTIPLLRKTANVYFDTSVMCDTGVIDEIVGKYGSERLLFGSGMPFYVPAGGLGLVLYARIPDRDKENILAANWLVLERDIAWQ